MEPCSVTHFQGIVDEVADRLREQHRVARHGGLPVGLKREHDALLLLDDRGSHGGSIDAHESGAARTRVDLRQPQQRVEHAHHAVQPVGE
jgi:hypothetical protein